jgi:mycothiol synthase
LPDVVIRDYQADDLIALVQLNNEADAVDQAGLATTAEAFRHTLAEPGSAPRIYLALYQDRLVGYVLVRLRHRNTEDRVRVVGIVHPRWRRQGVGTLLMRLAEQDARKRKGSLPLLFDFGARDRVSGASELALSLGMQPARNFLYMELHGLDELAQPTLPAGITVRHYIVGQDEVAFAAAYTDAFADHWGSIPHTQENERQRQNAPGFCQDNTLLAMDAQGTMAGFCVVLFETPNREPPMIDDLGVRPRYQGRGLGRAMLLTGLHHIRNSGIDSASIAVDEDNVHQAHRLYESIGFVTKARTTLYCKEIG